MQLLKVFLTNFIAVLVLLFNISVANSAIVYLAQDSTQVAQLNACLASLPVIDPSNGVDYTDCGSVSSGSDTANCAGSGSYTASQAVRNNFPNFGDIYRACLDGPKDVFCDEVPYTPPGLGLPLGSFCVPDSSGFPVDSQYDSCLLPDGETHVTIPRCFVVQCPDGSFIDTSLGESCPLPKQCPDGQIVYGSQACPPPLFVCPDGTKVTKQEFCPDPTEDLKTCFDGSVIPVTQTCPIKPQVMCSDGTLVDDVSSCPEPDKPPVFCSDGSRVQDISSCPVPQTTPSSVTDSSTSTSTSTTTNTTTNESSTTVSNSTTVLSLDSVNSRLDKSNTLLEGIKDSLTPGNTSIDGFPDLYKPQENYTFTTVSTAFADRVKQSDILVGVSSAFDVNVSGGQCPTYISPSVSSGIFTFPSIVIDQQCSSVMTSVFSLISVVLIAVATFYSIRIAFL